MELKISFSFEEFSQNIVLVRGILSKYRSRWRNFIEISFSLEEFYRNIVLVGGIIGSVDLPIWRGHNKTPISLVVERIIAYLVCSKHPKPKE